jgi:predicted RND superfamily exporter protein
MAIANVAGTQIIFLGYLIVNCIQLGATIDYGILYTDRYLDRRKHEDRRASVEGAISDSLPTILTTGLILFGAGMVLSAVSGIPVVALLGRLIGIGGLISVLMIIFVLPQVLLLADRLLHKKGAQ